MPDPAANPELLPSLRRLVRGLTALFWGVPLGLIVGFQNVLTGWFHGMGALPPLLAAGLLLFGTNELAHFQKQERVWIQALERLRLYALVNVGLAPFVFFWLRLPEVDYYAHMLALLGFSTLGFLHSLNHVLRRLAAMLPDETLRADTRLFTGIGLALIGAAGLVLLVYCGLSLLENPPVILALARESIYGARRWLLTFLVFFPTASTMALLWKAKEAVLASVFGRKS